MNKVYRVIFNEVTRTWTAVCETARSRGKSSTTLQKLVRIAQALGLSAFLTAKLHAAEPPPTALPSGGQVAAGVAQLLQGGTAQAPVLNIDQSTQRAVINWGTFNVGAAATVNFNQPNAQSATLNRVHDVNPSHILGKVNAPGSVTLINPQGVHFGRSAVLDVGALTASTLNQTDADFMQGKAIFNRQGSTGAVVNQGQLKAALNGYIALLAPRVRNEGIVIAKQGTVVMAGGEQVRLHFDATQKLASITTTPSQIATLVENRTAVQAPDGLIILSATALDALTGQVINSGHLNASSLTQKGGRILLEGGSIQMTATSRIEATGKTGGGEVLVGGDWQGGANAKRRILSGPDAMRQAVKVTMEAGAVIDVSATDTGKGGTVVLRTDPLNPQSVTTVRGTVLAQGGPNGGEGGAIETTGHTLDTVGAILQAHAPKGQAGQWLLNHRAPLITQDMANTMAYSLSTGTHVTQVVMGDMVWQSGVNLIKQSGPDAELRLETTHGGNIVLGPSVRIESQVGQLGVTLKASGHIDMKAGATIITNGGAVRYRAFGYLPMLLTRKPEDEPDSATTPIDPLSAGTPLGPSRIDIGGLIDVSSSQAQGGLVTVEADHITLQSSSSILATGATGGGAVLVGGDWQGGANEQRRVFADPKALHQATTVTMAQGASIDASATDNGKGGTVVLWSDITKADSITFVDGSLFAKAGVNGGDGGQIETSGRFLDVGNHISVSTKSIKGKDGEWLLDPDDLWIRDPSWSGWNYSTTGTTQNRVYTAQPAAVGAPGSALVAGAYTMDRGGGVTTVRTDTIVTALGQGNVRVVASGLIDVSTWEASGIANYYINSTTSNRLTLEAGTSIHIYSGTGSTGKTVNLPNGTLELLAGTTITQNLDGVGGSINAGTLILGRCASCTGTPSINLTNANNQISQVQASNIGAISLTSGVGLTVNANGIASSGAVQLSSSTHINLSGNINTTGGGITITAQSITQAAGVSVNTSGANIAYTASGLATTASIDNAIRIGDHTGSRSTLNANGGNITLQGSYGSSGTAGDFDSAIWIFGTDIRTSGAGAISITGDASNSLTATINSVFGLNLTRDTLIQSQSGAIQLTGIGGRASNNSRGFVIDASGARLLSASGAITIRDQQPSNTIAGYSYSGLYLRPGSASDAHILIGADGSNVTSSSSSITIQSDRLTFDANGSSTIRANTTGVLTMESIGSSFAGAINTQPWNFGPAPGALPALGGLTIGKSTNTTSVLVASSVAAAGAVSVYGSRLFLGGDLTSSAGGNLLLQGSGDVTLVGNASTSGTFTATAGAANSFLMGMNYSTGVASTITANGGVTINAGTSHFAGNVTTTGTGISVTGNMQVANLSASPAANPVTFDSGGGAISLTGGTISGYSGTLADYAVLSLNRGKAATGSGVTISAVTAGSNSNLLHSFTVTGNDTFYTPYGVSAVDYLVVGGGGGGGNSQARWTTGGGGGGGGVADASNFTLTGSGARVLVGAGGAQGTQGGDSAFANVLVGGGGRGGDTGANVTTTGAQTYTGAVTLSGGARTLTGASINTQSTLAGGNNALTIAGAADIDGDYTDLISLSITGAANIGANVTTTGAQGYNGAVTVSAASTLSTTNSNVTFGNALTLGENLTVNTGAGAGDISVTGAIDGAKALSLSAGTGAISLSETLGQTTRLGAVTLNSSGATTLAKAVTAASLTTDTGGSLVINGGSVDTTGAQTYGEAITLRANTTLTTSNAALTFSSTVNSDAGQTRALTLALGSGQVSFGGEVGGTQTLGAIDITGALDLNAAVAGAASLTVSEASNLGASVTTSGAQSYNGAVTVSAASTLSTTNSNVTFGNALTLGESLTVSTGTGAGDISVTGAIDGAKALSLSAGTGAITLSEALGQTTRLGAVTLNSSGATTLAKAVTAASLTTDTGGSLVINGGSVDTTGAQTYGEAITLGANTTLTGTTIHTQSTLNGGGNALTITGAADIDGDYTGLSSLSITGASNLGANVTTTGAQTYTGAVTLSGGARTLTGATINTRSTLNGGGNALTITGDADIDGDYTGLSSLSITGASNIGANVITTGTQYYAGAVILSSDVTFSTADSSSAALSFGASIDGDGVALRSLDTRSNGTVTFAGSIGVNAKLKSLRTTAEQTRDYVVPTGKTVLGPNVMSVNTELDQVYGHLEFLTNSDVRESVVNTIVSVNTATDRTVDIYPLRLSSTSGSLNFLGIVEGGHGAKDARRSLFLNAGKEVTFNQRVGFDATTNEGNILANYTRHFGVYRLDVTAGVGINILANITTYEHMNFNSDVRIGSHSDNDLTRYLFSMDPAVNFLGKVDGVVADRYFLDVRAIGFDASVRNQPPDHRSQPLVEFAKDVGSMMSLKGLTTQAVIASISEMKPGENFQRVPVSRSTDAGIVRFRGNITTSGGQTHMANRVEVSGAGSRGTEFNGTSFDMAIGSGGIVSPSGGRPRIRFSTNPTGETLRQLQRAGATITSMPSDATPESVMANQARNRHAVHAFEDALDAMASTLPSVEIGDLEELPCDRDANDQCKIRLPVHLSGKN